MRNEATALITLTLQGDLRRGDVRKRIPCVNYTPQEFERQITMRAMEAARDYVVKSGLWGTNPYSRPATTAEK